MASPDRQSARKQTSSGVRKPIHSEKVPRQRENLEPLGKSRFADRGGVTLLRHQKLVAQRLVGLFSVEKGGLRLGRLDEGVFRRRRIDRAVVPLLQGTVAAVVGVVGWVLRIALRV